MKKFLIFSVFVFSLIFTQFAQAYSPQYGDLKIVYSWYCNECEAYYKQTVIEPRRYSDPPPQQAHPYGCHGNKKQAHKWTRTYSNERYMFSNGGWRRM